MVTFGDGLLYASAVAGVIALAGLLLKELKNSDVLKDLISPMILACTWLLTFAYLLLTYYFVAGDFTLEYVWQYSSRDLPLIYKISGAWAGQPGTYLLWVWVIFLSAAWLALTTKHATPLSRRTQIITLIIGIYFILITRVLTPFKTIYEGRPDLIGYIPPDGSGLNALLVNFWMIIHPPLMFIGYAAITIPFAAAIVYLLTKDDGWEELSRQWSRFTWLFLGMGIAVGGVWAYLVLGWGGFWAWDPVETASFIPWLTLTAYLHAAALHRKNRSTFSIAAPILAAVSFILVLYAAIVVRSGLFNSVHAFGEASTGTLLIISLFASALVSGGLGMRRYLEEPDKIEEDRGFWNKTSIFYVTLLVFVILAFVSFWGITYPVFIQLTQGLKVGVASDTKNFFNVWSYPFTLVLLLALGFCLNYSEKEKKKQKKILFIVAGLTIIAMLVRLDNFYVLDHNSPFWLREPEIYKLIGSISLLSIFPPLIYAGMAVADYLIRNLGATSKRARIKSTGLTMVHIAVVLILLGSIISSTREEKIEGINIPLSAKGELVDIGKGYAMRIVDFSTRSLTEAGSSGGTRILDIYNDPEKFASDTGQVSGRVTDVLYTQTNATPVTYTTYFEINDGTGSIWVATQAGEPLIITKGSEGSVRGFLMGGFTSSTLNRTFDLVILSRPDEIGEAALSGDYTVQSVKLEVYKGASIIGSGTAEYLAGKSGSGTFPMVSSSITGTDVYVIFQGLGGGFVPLTLQIKPAINFVWIGIVLFAAGIILIMAVKTKKVKEG